MRSTLLALLLALAPCAPALAAGVRVEVDGIEPGGGDVYVTLCQGGLTEASCARGRKLGGTAPSLSVIFDDVAPGTYAVAAFQDENGNGVVDRTGLGLPVEPYGLTEGAGRRARPSFAEAAFFLVEPGAAVRVRLIRALQRR